MASVIISNSGSLVLNDGSSTVPKGGYTVSTSNDEVYVRSGSVWWKLDYKDTTLDGSGFGSAKELAAALSDFSRGGPGPGPEPGDAVWGGITGALSDQSDLQSALNSKANSADLGTAAEADSSDFATAAQGALAGTAVQPGDLPAAPTWTTISGKPSFVAEGANAAAARTALGLGTAATTDSTDYATAAQGTLANTAVQPAAIANVVRSEQEESVGTVITNMISLTQAEYDGLATKLPSTYYIITD